MRRKKKRERDTEASELELDMTPMIDCVFLLLIFFMVATKFRTPEGRLLAYLPQDKGMMSSAQTTDIDEIRINLEMQDTGPVIWLNRDEYVGTDWTQLDARLGEMQAVNPTWPVVIDGEPKIPFDYVVQSLNLCVRNNFTDISFAAPKPEIWRKGQKLTREEMAGN